MDANYRLKTLGDPVGKGAMGSRYGEMPVVVKMPHTNQVYSVAMEYVAGQLAMAVGLPSPPGTLVRLPLNPDDSAVAEGIAFALFRFGIDGESVPEVIGSEVVEKNPFLAAGIVVFDQWIANDDRNSGNLAMDDRGRVVIYDASHCLIGTAGPSQAIALATTRRDYVCLHAGCLAPELKSAADVDAWVEIISGVHDRILEAPLELVGSTGMLTTDEVAAVASLLKHRRDTLTRVVRENRGHLPKINDWGSE